MFEYVAITSGSEFNLTSAGGTDTVKIAAKPSAYNLEAAYSFDKKQTVSLAYSGTSKVNEAETEANQGRYEGLVPESQIALGYNYKLSDNIKLETAYLQQKDYSDSKGGTDDTISNIVARVKVAF